MLPRVTLVALAVATLVTTVLTGLSPAAVPVASGAPAAARTSAHEGPPKAQAGPPRNHTSASQLIVQQVFVTTGVDSDHDGTPDVVRVVVARPPAALVGGRRLATVGLPSPYYSCCLQLRSRLPGHPVAGQQPTRRVQDLIYQDLTQDALEWVDSGYAYARIASLGTNGSTGCVTLGGPAETAGTTAVVDWLNGRAVAHDAHGRVVRASWADGDVGLLGKSYGGTLANTAAATGVPGLKAIVSMSGISSWYDFFRQGGLVRYPEDFDGVDADSFARFVDTRADPRVCDRAISEIGRLEDRRTGDYNGFWADRNVRTRASSVHAAVLVGQGLADHDVEPSQAAQWYADLRRAGAPVQVWWDHGDHGTKVPGWLVHLWFDHYLYGVNDIDHGGRAWVTSASGGTRRYASWPRPGSHPVLARLGAAGSRASFTDDPAVAAAQACARPDPRHAVTTPLPGTGLDLSGTPTAHLRLSFDRPSANVTVALCVVRGGRSALLTQGWTDPQNHASLLHGTPLVRGHAYDVDVDLQPVDQHLPPGARLTLVVMASDHAFTLRPPPGTHVVVGLGGSTVTLPVVG